MENVKGLSVAFAEPKDAEEHDCPSIGSCIVSKILKVDLPANDLSKMFTYQRSGGKKKKPKEFFL